VAVKADIDGMAARLLHSARGAVNARRVKLQRFERRLGDPRRLTEEPRQRIDEALRRMEGAVRKRIAAARRGVDEQRQRLDRAHPRTRLARDRGTLEALAQRLGPASKRYLEARARLLSDTEAKLGPAVRRLLDARRATLGTRVAQLDALSPLAILSRGYSVVLARGAAVIDAATLREGDEVSVRLHQGEFDAEVKRTRRAT
jgi:exodeoxyribonuclease VII large subunit